MSTVAASVSAVVTMIEVKLYDQWMVVREEEVDENQDIFLLLKDGSLKVCDIIVVWHSDLMEVWHSYIFKVWHSDVMKVWHSDVMKVWHSDVMEV